MIFGKASQNHPSSRGSVLGVGPTPWRMDDFVMLFVNLDRGMNFFFKFCQNYLGPSYDFFHKTLKIPLDEWWKWDGPPLIMMVYITGGGDGGVRRRVD